MDGAPLAEFEDGDCGLLSGGGNGGTAGESGDAYQGCDELHDYDYIV